MPPRDLRHHPFDVGHLADVGGDRRRVGDFRADGRQRVAAAPDQDQAAPVPLLPPVMTTTLPSNRMPLF